MVRHPSALPSAIIAVSLIALHALTYSVKRVHTSHVSTIKHCTCYDTCIITTGYMQIITAFIHSCCCVMSLAIWVCALSSVVSVGVQHHPSTSLSCCAVTCAQWGRHIHDDITGCFYEFNLCCHAMPCHAMQCYHHGNVTCARWDRHIQSVDVCSCASPACSISDFSTTPP